MTAAPTLSWAAHAAHYTLIGGGLGLLAAVLVPTLGRDRQPAPAEATRRLRALHAELEAATRVPVTGPSLGASLGHWSGHSTRQVPLSLAVASVSSAAAAAVHAAASPEHLEVGWRVGGFFVVAALAQLGWAAVLLTSGPSRRLLLAGAVGNGLVVVLWLLTRTVGLPVGQTEVEAVGMWDVAATVWEITVVLSCTAALRLRSRSDPLVRGCTARARPVAGAGSRVAARLGAGPGGPGGGRATLMRKEHRCTGGR